MCAVELMTAQRLPQPILRRSGLVPHLAGELLDGSPDGRRSAVVVVVGHVLPKSIRLGNATPSQLQSPADGTALDAAVRIGCFHDIA